MNYEAMHEEVILALAEIARKHGGRVEVHTDWREGNLTPFIALTVRWIPEEAPQAVPALSAD